MSGRPRKKNQESNQFSGITSEIFLIRKEDKCGQMNIYPRVIDLKKCT